jgi:hypothetical protein
MFSCLWGSKVEVKSAVTGDGSVAIGLLSITFQAWRWHKQALSA